MALADPAHESKWEAYYATDPLTAPWDTHAVSSQLQDYLCTCPLSCTNATTTTIAAAPALGAAALEDGAASASRAPAAEIAVQVTAASPPCSAGRSSEDAVPCRGHTQAPALQCSATEGLEGQGVGACADVGGAAYGTPDRRAGHPYHQAVQAGAGSGVASGPRCSLHVCQLCAHLKPTSRPADLPDRADPADLRAGPPVATDSPYPVDQIDAAGETPSGSRRVLRALELCCGTGASLAFMRHLGFSVVGVELVEAACRVAAARLAAVEPADGAPTAVPVVKTVGDQLRRWAADTAPTLVEEELRPDGLGSASCREDVLSPQDPSGPDLGRGGTAAPALDAADGSAAAGSPAEPRATHTLTTVQAQAPPALLVHGDVFATDLPRGYFDFAYDCQGLHAMPPPLRRAYIDVLRDALRRGGGMALLLVGRAECDLEAPAVEGQAVEACGGVKTGAAALADAAAHAMDRTGNEAGACCCCTGAGAAGDGATGGCMGAAAGVPGVQGPAESIVVSKGPSLMSQRELRALFAAEDWEWCWCKPTRFDLTPAYTRLPRSPPAWCLLVRRR